MHKKGLKPTTCHPAPVAIDFQGPFCQNPGMSVEHTSRTGRTYYLHEKTTAAGKRSYSFSMDAGGQCPATLPDGYEIYENVGGKVFLRKITPPLILPQELSRVEDALRKHGEPWQYRAEIKKNAIVVHEAADMAGLDKIVRVYFHTKQSEADKLKHAHYMAVMRFVLADKKSREFVTERFCFTGSIDDWMYIGGPDTLAAQTKQFVKHLGKESFYELY
jgi:hypothetical protein